MTFDTKELVASLGSWACVVFTGEPADDLHLTNDLKLDSLDRVNMAIDLELAYGVHISDATAQTMNTYGDMKRVVGDLLEAKYNPVN